MRLRAPQCRPLPGRRERLCVLIADPDGLARAMSSQALYTSPRVAAVLSASHCTEARQLTRRYQPAVLLLDTTLPGADSIPDTITGILDACPHTRLLTMAVEDDHVALQALRAGAVGHLDKHLPPTVLTQQVIRAADGEAVVPRRLTMQLLNLLHRTPDTGWRPLHSCLTTREWEVIDLLADGAGTQQIADALVLSRTTVYSHIKSISRKLGVHTRTDAIHAADKLRHQEALGTNLPSRVK